MSLLTTILIVVGVLIGLALLYFLGNWFLKLLQVLPSLCAEAGMKFVDATTAVVVSVSSAIWNAPGIRETRLFARFIYREVIPFPFQRLFGDETAGIGNWKGRSWLD